MSRPRAADDFESIRLRLEELRREQQKPGQPMAADIAAPGHRGPCVCGMSLFADECDGCCKAL